VYTESCFIFLLNHACFWQQNFHFLLSVLFNICSVCLSVFDELFLLILGVEPNNLLEINNMDNICKLVTCHKKVYACMFFSPKGPDRYKRRAAGGEALPAAVCRVLVQAGRQAPQLPGPGHRD
jgi:hypothetical protein